MTTTPHPHAEILLVLYTDFSLLDRYAADDVVLHRADRVVGDPPVVGKEAVLRHEAALLELTGGTLRMDVQHIAANDHFGAVLGVLRSTRPQPVAMPFCGLWRFEDGLIVEHWENAYHPAELLRLLIGEQLA
ncbi:hypothetical protein F4553_000647 [Allocatelliglobosispora scoriae]|uniref:SnoaL-like domain-containing protein n=1 Tax=Allocatelliglobosispora scoriae TaxID=643052 RepID=A0A841BIW8_9ACTN|nr:nuclear transport factor 2 family protein [Allocatelliglobosispora scoriae]MBB5867268.1 hypothetical protein [Allocatelliglobosispora scoriae]